MRVFYIDEEEEKSKRQYYVKIDNVSVPEELKGFKAIKAATTDELIERVKDYYEFNKNLDINIQLWSNANFTGKRLEILDKIPVENEFIWVRAVLNKKEQNRAGMLRNLEKHQKYKTAYKPNDFYWGLGVEHETYLETSKLKQVTLKELKENRG